jgi:hypothetical protein
MKYAPRVRTSRLVVPNWQHALERDWECVGKPSLRAKLTAKVRGPNLVHPAGELPVVKAAAEVEQAFQQLSPCIAFALKQGAAFTFQHADFGVDHPTDHILWRWRHQQNPGQPDH